MIVDVHTHAWDVERHMTEEFVKQASIARTQPISMAVNFDDYMQAMAKVDKAIVFGLKARLVGLYVPNEYIAQFVAKAPDKIIGFMSLDPTEPNFMDDFEHAYHDLKLKGIKLGPIYAGFDPRSRKLDALYAKAQKEGLPILFHAGTSFVRWGYLEFTRPYLWDEVARLFPELKIVLAHLAHPWESECIAVIRKHPNVYADISGLHYRPWQFYNSLMLCQEYGVMHKLLFGSDYPFTTPEETIKGLRSINRFTNGTSLPRISETAIEELIHRDALTLLGLS